MQQGEVLRVQLSEINKWAGLPVEKKTGYGNQRG
jgi:hypothetical protein